MSDQERDSKLEEIAKGCLGISTLNTRNSDRLDFHEIAVWNLKQALQLAYTAGRDSKPAKPGRTYDHDIPPYAHIMTVKDWKEAVANGSFNDDDGTGYWAKDGKECQKAEVFCTPAQDATHVAWYNK